MDSASSEGVEAARMRLPDGSASRLPIVTILLCSFCSLLYVAIADRSGGRFSWETVARWGYLPPDRIWNGAYWGLVSSAFVHLALWHVVFNVYWLWMLGRAVERVLGPSKYLAFVLMAAAVSSSTQLAASGNSGHGASGVVYALFGLMWSRRQVTPAFSEALNAQTASLFWMWLIGCMVATHLGIIEVGNAAHVGGLVFGLLIAQCLTGAAARRQMAVAGTALLVVLSFVPLVWSPWSSTWVGHRAYRAHLAGDYDAAIALYRRSIVLGGDRLWALENLAFAYHSKHEEKEYTATLADIRALDAQAAASVEAEVLETPGAETRTTSQ